MKIDDEPSTDAELVERLRALYAASSHSGGARDDFWDCVSHHIGWIIDLAARCAKKRGGHETPNPRAVAAGKKSRASLTPERRREIAVLGANARWNRQPTHSE